MTARLLGARLLGALIAACALITLTPAVSTSTETTRDFFYPNAAIDSSQICDRTIAWIGMGGIHFVLPNSGEGEHCG